MSSPKILYRGAKVWVGSGTSELDVLLDENNKIERLAPIGQIDSTDATLIDVQGALILPGLFDMHVHLREPGYESKETILGGSRLAAMSGYTGIACMANTNPVNDSALITNYIKSKAAQGPIDVHPIGAISMGLMGEKLADIGSMVEAGCVAISDDGMPVMNSYVMRKAMEYSKMFGIPVISHAEDRHLAGQGVINEGFFSMKLGLRGIPAEAETIMVARDLILAEKTGAKYHVAHVSTEGTVELLMHAKDRGITVTSEVTPHHLFLTDEDLLEYNTNFKVNPPLRTRHDRSVLREALRQGIIDCVATDHAPHTQMEKASDMIAAPFGLVGLSTALPLMLELIRSRDITLADLVRSMVIKPREILKLPIPEIREGALAEMVIIDPGLKYKISEEMLGKSKNSPFLGREVMGGVLATYHRGKLVYAR